MGETPSTEARHFYCSLIASLTATAIIALLNFYNKRSSL